MCFRAGFGPERALPQRQEPFPWPRRGTPGWANAAGEPVRFRDVEITSLLGEPGGFAMLEITLGENVDGKRAGRHRRPAGSQAVSPAGKLRKLPLCCAGARRTE